MEQTLNFKVKENTYLIEFPTVGKFRRIEALKQVFSNNTYSSLSKTETVASQHAADMVDIEATLSILTPKLFEDFKCNSFEDLGLLDYKELRNAYADQFTPWWNEILKVLALDSNE